MDISLDIIDKRFPHIASLLEPLIQVPIQKRLHTQTLLKYCQLPNVPPILTRVNPLFIN